MFLKVQSTVTCAQPDKRGIVSRTGGSQVMKAMAVRVAVGMAAGLMSLGLAEAQVKYTVTPLLFQNHCSSPTTWAKGLNNRGDVFGVTCVPGLSTAFVYTGGTMVRIPVDTGFDLWQVYGMNNLGDVVGNNDQRITDPTTQEQVWVVAPFLFSGGTMSSLSTTALNCTAILINDNRQIVGGCPADSIPDNSAVIYSGGSATAIPAPVVTPPNPNATSPNYLLFPVSVNNAGQILLNGDVCWPCSSQHAYLATFTGGLTDLGTLGGQFTQGWAMNQTGQVAGVSETATPGVSNFFLYTGGRMVDLRAVSQGNQYVSNGSVSGINDSGQVLANCRVGGQNHACILTPGSMTTWVRSAACIVRQAPSTRTATLLAGPSSRATAPGPRAIAARFYIAADSR